MKPVAPRRSGDDSRAGSAARIAARQPDRFPAVRMRRNRKHRLVAAAGGRERAVARRPDLADLRRRGQQQARARAVDAGRRSPQRRPRRRRRPSRPSALGIPAVALFPYTDPKLRTDDGREALNPDNLVCRATRAIRKAGLDVGVLLDVALDPYTSHGHDGLMRDGEIVNDETLDGPGAAGARAGRGRLRHHRPVRHDGRPHRRHPPGAGGRRHTRTCRSWPTRPSMPRRSTARSAMRSARRRR